MRIKNSLLNIISGCLCYAVVIISGFLIKPIFIKSFGTDYDGIDFTFGTFISILEIVELGLGMSIVYKFYDPIAKKNFIKISSILKFLRKAYLIIILLVSLLGICFSVFAVKNVHVHSNISQLWLFKIFFLYLIDLICSYVYYYKRVMIIADQHFRTIMITRAICLLSLFFAQVFILNVFKSLELFLIAKIISRISESLIISYKFDREYKHLDIKGATKIDDEEKREIIRTMKAMFFHKIGGMSLRQISGFIVSSFFSLTIRSIYNRYILIITSLWGISTEFFNGTMASFGNLLNEDKKDKVEQNLNVIIFLNFLIYSSFCCAFFSSSEPFMKFWLPDHLHFDTITNILLTTYLYVYGTRQGIEMVKVVAGIYVQGRYFPILESIVNFALSFVLASKIGIKGVIIGNITSCICIPFFVNSSLLYKIVFNKSPFRYYKKYFVYTILAALEVFITHFCLSFFRFKSFLVQSLISAIMCLIISTVINIIIFYRTKEFIHLKVIADEIFSKIIKKNKS